jgi:predicted component of type VI protein secretion system
MDRGVPTEEVLAEMRAADPPMHYLVGTPKGRLTRLEKQLVAKPWQEARPGVQVKLLPQEGELYVLAQSRDRVAKERAMRRRQLKRLWARLKQLSNAGTVDMPPHCRAVRPAPGRPVISGRLFPQDPRGRSWGDW